MFCEAGVAIVQLVLGQIVAVDFTSTVAREVSEPTVAVIVRNPADEGAVKLPMLVIEPAEADHVTCTGTTTPFVSRAMAVNDCVSLGPRVTKRGRTSSDATADCCEMTRISI